MSMNAWQWMVFVFLFCHNYYILHTTNDEHDNMNARTKCIVNVKWKKKKQIENKIWNKKVVTTNTAHSVCWKITSWKRMHLVLPAGAKHLCVAVAVRFSPFRIPFLLECVSSTRFHFMLILFRATRGCTALYRTVTICLVLLSLCECVCVYVCTFERLFRMPYVFTKLNANLQL